ncbi:hypothetical protein [Spirosoma endbachense]|uniref:Uncharacterized protein n=1 Tax=Spirosoma endbachense TaxID=2666025 RepID=A0A6P1W1P7_9BACT|nr:hypothetical protein [Spirosoma endbachense]QHV97947.1 hypothetical protein GJR95_24355 [Spirosoma endbachense]
MNEKLTLLQRLQSPTPSFYQKATKVGVIVAIVAAGLTGVSDYMTEHEMAVPGLLSEAIKVVGWISAGIAGFSRFGVRSEQ